MAVTQRYLSMDGYFHSCNGEKIIINDMDYFSTSHKEMLKNALMTIYNSTSVMSTIPTCECGNVKGRFNRGQLCYQCGTICSEMGDNVEPILWLKTLSPEVPFLNPGFWLVLRKLIGARKVDWLRWLSDTRYNPNSIKIPDEMLGIKDMIGGRGYKLFINNIENIINYLMLIPKNQKNGKIPQLESLLEQYRENKNILYSMYLPILNKRLFVVENTAKGKFVNLSTSDVIDIASQWVKNANDALIPRKNNEEKVSWNTGTIISKLASLGETYISDYLTEKKGIFRKHVYGARSHFTFRTVIVSITGPHDMNEIIPPWSVMVTAFRPHLLNKLTKLGINYGDANRMLFSSVNKYNKLIDDLLTEMIVESEDQSIPIMVLRNPSLHQGSTLLVKIRRYTKDPFNKTTGLSQLIVQMMNGDYDGDELNFTLVLDNRMKRLLEPISSYYNIVDQSKPYSIGGFLTLQKPANATISSWLEDKTIEDGDTIYDSLVDCKGVIC